MAYEGQVELPVFLSWSGQRSNRAAQVFRDWLPRALQNVRPYYNADDTSKGLRWANEISSELARTAFGIIFLTRENLASPWILFEAGALSKLEKSKVAPFLLDLEPTDVSGPLAQFQATKPNHDDCYQLVRSINQSLGQGGLEPSVLRDVFEQWWPKLDGDLQSAMKAVPTMPGVPRRSDRDLIEEMLQTVRRLEMESLHDDEHNIVIYETAQTMWHAIEGVMERIVMDLQHSDDECSARCLSLIREIESVALGFAAKPHRVRGG